MGAGRRRCGEQPRQCDSVVVDMDNKIADHPELLWMFLAGLFTGLGKLLSSDQPLRLRNVVGRALVSGGLGSAGALTLIWVPEMPLPAMIGMSCALASLGTSALENIVNKYLGLKP